jgi:hypothetical protein
MKEIFLYSSKAFPKEIQFRQVSIYNMYKEYI